MQIVRTGLRAVAIPAVVLWAIVISVGFAVKAIDPAFDPAVSRALEGARTSTWDGVTAVVSGMATTEVLTGTCLALVGILWLATRQWWFAIVPAVALLLQTLIFLTSSLVVGRERPEVSKLDDAPPTSSFPSGHTGASTAFFLAVAVCAGRIRSTAVRWIVWTVCAVVPLAVAASRVYRGMHHLTDVLAGLLVGVACALLARRYLLAVSALERTTSPIA